MELAPTSEIWKYFDNIKEEGMAECKLCKQRLRNNRSYNLKLHIRKVHSNKHIIEEYFELNVLESIATCKTCNQSIKNRLCNIRLHMRRMHSIEVKLPEDALFDGPPSPQPYDEEQIKAVLKVAKRKMAEQGVVNNEKRPTHRLYIKMDKGTILRSVIGLIVEDCVSPKVFSSRPFEAILSPMCDAINNKAGRDFKIDEEEIERILSSVAVYIRNDFSNELNCRLLSIKIDNDLNASPNTFCVSAQFINNGELQKRILGLIEVTDDNQLQEEHIKQVLYKFNIDSNQIIAAFYDNTKFQHKKPVKNCDYLKEVEQLKLYPNIFLGDVKIEPYLGSIAQLCLLDIFKNSKIIQPFLECRNLVKFISDQTNGYFELFHLNKLPLPQLDSPWHASSTCKMMQDLLEARPFLQEIKFEQPEKVEEQFNCNEELWLFIEAFCNSTKYLQKTILKYCSEELHIGDFYAQWLKCQLLTQKLLLANDKPNDIVSIILTEILKSIKTYTNELLKQERVTACLYLDPRFHRILTANQKAIAVEYLKKLWSLSKLYIDDAPQSKSEEEFQLLDDDEDACLNEFLSNEVQTKDKGSNEVFKKIVEFTLAFQMADTNMLSFWRGLKASDPEMHTLSSFCFAVPATEIYNKTLYSHVYRLDKDSDLSIFTKENLLNARLNANTLDDALKHMKLTNVEGLDSPLSISDSEDDSCEISDDGSSNMASTSTACSGNAEISSSTAAEDEFI